MRHARPSAASRLLRRAPGSRLVPPALRRLPATVASAALALAVLALAVLAVGPHLLGYRTVAMLTGSMAPTVEAGDLLVLRPQPVERVRAGQLLTFTAPLPDAPVVTHRVVTVTRNASGTVVTTKGDANRAADPWHAALVGPTAWEGVAVVPHGGQAVGLLRTPVVRVLSVWVLPLWLCVGVLRRVWRRRPAGRAALPA